MKINLLLLFSLMLFFFSSQAHAASEWRNNDKLLEVIRDISDRYNVHFTYDREIVEGVEVDEYTPEAYASVDDALNKVLAGTKLKYVMLEMKYVIIYQDDAEGMKSLEQMVEVLEQLVNQNKEKRFVSPISLLESSTSFRNVHLQKHRMVLDVSGIVTDQAGEPLIGVNVMVQGTTRGTATDFEGRFTLEDVNEKATLIFSYVGYQSQEIDLNGRSNISVIMIEDSQTLEEVVVVGYGTQKKSTLTGSVVSTSGEMLRKSPASTLSNTLPGRLPGLIGLNRTGEPGKDVADLLIRGKSTTGNSSPLIVIDGIWGRAGLNEIDPNDVEEITVLKDAAAAIYGSQAANGVILVTTKRGTKGKPIVSYNLNQGIVTPTRLPEMANSWSYAEFLNDELIRNGQNAKYTDEEIQKFRDGSDPIMYPNTNWISEVYSNHTTQSRQSISIRGGSDLTNYFISANYSNQNPLHKNGITNNNVLGVRSNIDFHITDNFKIGLDLNFDQKNRTESGVGIGTINKFTWRNYPYQIATYPNGLPGEGLAQYNPTLFTDETTGYTRDKRNSYKTKASLSYDIPFIKGMSAEGSIAYDKNHDFIKNFNDSWFVYSYNEVSDEYTPILGKPANPKPSLIEKYDQQYRWIALAKISHKIDFDRHTLNSFVAAEQSYVSSNYLRGERIDYITSAIDQLFAGDGSNQQTTGSASETTRKNYFGRISYDYDDKYLVDMNFRYDGSSIFHHDSRWGFFPGLSVGWRLSEEDFIERGFLNNLKIRGSWGEIGNDRIDPFQYLSTYSFTTGAFFGLNASPNSGIAPGVSPNLNVTWEVVQILNIGLDADMNVGNHNFGFNVDLFKENRNNILATRNASIPAFTGLKLPNENIGIVENKGFEFNLYYQLNRGNYSFDFSPNIAYARNKVIDIDEAESAQPWQMKTGLPIGSDLYYISSGIIQDRQTLENQPTKAGAKIGDLFYEDMNGDGIIDSRDRVRLDKTSIPEITFGGSLSFSYKNFDITSLLQGQARAWQYFYLEAGSSGNILQDWADNRYKEDNPDPKYPHLLKYTDLAASNQTDFFLENASFIRLKNLEIGYNIPDNILDKITFLNSMRFYFSSVNLFTISKMKFVDPEGTHNLERGQFYPMNRIFNFGINIQF